MSGITTRQEREELALGRPASRPEPRATILVVDDEPKNRHLIRAQLASRYTVLESGDGEAALDLLDREPIDLVLLDVCMPRMNGFEACRRIKALQSGTFLPVILLTSLNDQAHRNEGLAANADDYLGKPADRVELQLRVGAFLRIREQERAIQSQLAALHDLEALKDDLVSLLVHDLRNPLASFLPLVECAAESVTDPQIAEDLRIARDSAGKMQLALEDLLRVRQLEDGQIVPTRELVDLDDLCRSALRTVEGSARTREVTLEHVVEGPPAAVLDPGLVRRAIENLVGNGTRFTRRGTSVTVCAQQRGPLLEIAVADRGPGVPDAFKQRLFAKFRQATESSASGRPGFGLGLYLVRLVATAHGGSVTVEDRPGGGALFRLFLEAGGSLAP